MILASHLHMPSYFLKTFTEYPVVWVFVAGPESPFFKVSGLLGLPQTPILRDIQ